MIKRLIYIIAFTLILTSCSIHKIDIQQGNVLEKDTLDQLKTGMTISQVRFLLGNPSIRDPFHQNRWDYVYLFKSGQQGSTAEKQRLTLYFDGEVLTRIDRQDIQPAADSPQH